MNDRFVFVDELVPGIRWDAKYATWDNFTGKPVDGYAANRIVGTGALCAALERARERALALGFGLLVWDGYRPQLLPALVGAAGGWPDEAAPPPEHRTSRDGGEHDLMDAISHHGARGITHAEAENRRCLRALMEDRGFGAYEGEWWHYSLEEEPYPDTYFDFPISPFWRPHACAARSLS
jgi:D-alanyl-D-alanine dipeptidase